MNMPALNERLSRHRFTITAFAAAAGAATMIFLSQSTALPKDIIAAIGIVAMRLAFFPISTSLRERARETRPLWFVIETLIGGFAIVGFYRVAEQLLGMTWG